MGECIIKWAKTEHLDLIDNLQKQHRNALGFLTTEAILHKIAEQKVLIALRDSKFLGYAIVGSNMQPNLRLYQLCVEKACRGIGIGSKLMRAVEACAVEGSATSVILRSASDLKVNELWAKRGYTCICVEKGGKTTNRRINVWKKQVKSELFSEIAVKPAKD